ncbi:hypothetical protein ACT3SZ_00895 [Corynebacterium sp. AOP40-9SA-29]|uniref:hypothetical protein n=1 Tax=Corynebacterium sp. AOP40-9SA-29 TaxID=3457677 RepID=UPI0040341543
MGDIGEGIVLSGQAAEELDALYAEDPVLAERVDDALDEIESRIGQGTSRYPVFDGPDGLRYSRLLVLVGDRAAVIVWNTRHPQRVVAIDVVPPGII